MPLNFLKLQNERRRVERDLHDAVGQALAGLKMAVLAFENRLQNTHPTNTIPQGVEADRRSSFGVPASVASWLV